MEKYWRVAVSRWTNALQYIGFSKQLDDRVSRLFQKLLIDDGKLLSKSQYKNNIQVDVQLKLIENMLEKYIKEKEKNCCKSEKIIKKAFTQLNYFAKVEDMEVAQLGSGQSFGEQALLKQSVRGATIKCVETCFFGVLSKADYHASVGTMQRRQIEQKIELFQSCPQFQNWTRSSLNKFQFHWKKHKYYKSDIIYKQG